MEREAYEYICISLSFFLSLCVSLCLSGMLYSHLLHNDTNNERTLFAPRCSSRHYNTPRIRNMLILLPLLLLLPPLALLVFLSLQSKKTPALMAGKISADFFSRSSSRGLRETRLAHPPTQNTHSYIHNPTPPTTHTSHAISSMIFTPKCGYQKINHILPATKTLANLFFCARLTARSVNK